MLISTDRPAIPTRAALVAELQQLVRRRGAPSVTRGGALSRLSCVGERAGAESAELVGAALADLLPQLAAKLSDPSGSRAACALLSLSGSLARSGPSTRRQAAANALGMRNGDSFRRRHERPLLEDLAAVLLRVETAYRYRTRDVDLSRIDWIGRFQAYYRLYTPISGLRGDLLVLLGTQRERPGEFDYLIGQLGSSLWFYTRYLLEL